ncbi:hypothetical protein PsorP6_001651 [Peronosclerospora sorghi]|uniref:Uncharacterized protein n=1 Tax=Peronosclerospora sorghi TaxID=230839 RepID=A0ACC0WW31_9STRA|nr:hypothetical protein PsorP6_001651 [Peronosclerospora sorghi]
MDPARQSREEETTELWKAALEDDDTFTKLSDTELGSYAAHTPASAVELETRPRPTPPRGSAREPPPPRVKRKNFSKQLQLLCLERYAYYARAFGHLPDKDATQHMLERSFREFLTAGGAAEEPQLTYAEFLKLIRNRRREMQARRGAHHVPTPRTNVVAALTPAKRKLHEEQAKIRALIEIIDQARDHHQHPTRGKGTSSVGEEDPPPHRQQPRRRGPEPDATEPPAPIELALGSPPSSSCVLESFQPVVPSTSSSSTPVVDQVDAILHTHDEIRAIQREIRTRVRSISRFIRQQEQRHSEMDEPSSASLPRVFQGRARGTFKPTPLQVIERRTDLVHPSWNRVLFFQLYQTDVKDRHDQIRRPRRRTPAPSTYSKSVMSNMRLGYVHIERVGRRQVPQSQAHHALQHDT